MGLVQWRRAAKTAAAFTFTYTGIRRAMAAQRRRDSGGRRVVIVGYHRVVDDFDREAKRSIPGTLISQRTFQRHLEDAHAAGFEFSDMTHALDVLSGRRTSPKDLFVVTFDDGYRDIYRWAWPVLKRMGVPSVMYLPSSMIGTDRRFNHDRLFHLVRLLQKPGVVVSYDALPSESSALLRPVLEEKKRLSDALDDFLGEHPSRVLSRIIEALEKELSQVAEVVPEQGDIMNWDEVRAMAATGMEMGAHTQNHTVLTLESNDALRRELSMSKEEIEAQLHKPVAHFAYCNGWYSPEVVSALVACGYKSGVTTEDFPNRLGADPYTLKRKVLWENFSRGLFGAYSSCLTGCHFDDVFGILGTSHPVVGRRTQIAENAGRSP